MKRDRPERQVGINQGRCIDNGEKQKARPRRVNSRYDRKRNSHCDVGKKQKARPKGLNLKAREEQKEKNDGRIAISVLEQRPPR